MRASAIAVPMRPCAAPLAMAFARRNKISMLGLAPFIVGLAPENGGARLRLWSNAGVHRRTCPRIAAVAGPQVSHAAVCGGQAGSGDTARPLSLPVSQLPSVHQQVQQQLNCPFRNSRFLVRSST